jgi:hypothetical protein
MQRAGFSHLMTAVLALGMTAAVSAQTAAPVKPKPKHKPVPHSTLQDDVKALRDVVAAQQQQLQTQSQQMDQLKSQLQQVLDATAQANAAAQRAQSATDQANAAAVQAEQSATHAQSTADQASSSAAQANTQLAVVNGKENDDQQRVSALQDVLGRFRFSGDVRIRGEDFFQDGVATRNRARVRVRFGLDGKLNEDFIGGFALATGSLGDPTTTNETFTNFFDRKTIGLDRGYITYNPVAANWLSLTGGKFAYPWYRTSLTMDPDINPEGFDEKLSFNRNGSVTKNFTVQAFELLYNENSKGDDSFGIGGQVSGIFKFGPWTTTPSFGLIDWRFVDALLSASAFANQATTSGNPAVPISGEGPGCAGGFGLPSVPPCGFAANGLTNATYTDSKGAAHFLSGYEYADAILNNQIQTGSKRLPLNLILEYEDNLKAAAHPLNSAGVVISSLGAQGQAYLGDFSIGQAKNRNDVQFGYSYWRIEQDAILAAWAESDQRAPTNILQQRVYAVWKLRNNILAQYTLWFGHTLNTSLEHAALATGTTPGAPEPTLKRQQFDLIYSF